MKYYLKERIGNPDLFTGRKEDLRFYLWWIERIKREISQSTAMFAIRKSGKTALLQRLFNITFHKNDGVIPFYYEIKEFDQWIVSFAQDFFLHFIFQYIAFKSRNPEYLRTNNTYSLARAKESAKKEGLDYLIPSIENMEEAVSKESEMFTWEIARNMPVSIASLYGDYVVQFFDEFQYINSKIYRDKGCTMLMNNLAGSYLGTAENKVAPLLVTGSWVGEIMDMVIMMLPGRFKFRFLKPMPEDEAVEMVFNYSQINDAPVTEETAYTIARLGEGSTSYISSIMNSYYPAKDLTTAQGVIETLEYETLNDEGSIKGTWMEYLASAFGKINQLYAKRIVLYLCKHRDREFTRKELLDKLDLNMTDNELEQKLKALVKADIIEQGRTNYDYRGVRGNIFDKVFRGVYQKEIDSFDENEIHNEYKAMYETMKAKYNQLLGQFNYHKGYYAEYYIIRQLQFHAYKHNALFKSITNNLPCDFDFVQCRHVWSYSASLIYSKDIKADILARPIDTGYALIGEVKNRDSKKFSIDEARNFHGKMREIIALEKLDKAIGFVFSRQGFTDEARDYLIENAIAYTNDERWLDEV
ncbi:MAG TPA: hypothetical protein VJL89_09330 [Thermodesulfovibrionia bacterium]|nr:hypothetical protein [Thermodesulfovibrionia bacterium]